MGWPGWLDQNASLLIDHPNFTTPCAYDECPNEAVNAFESWLLADLTAASKLALPPAKDGVLYWPMASEPKPEWPWLAFPKFTPAHKSAYDKMNAQWFGPFTVTLKSPEDATAAAAVEKYVNASWKAFSASVSIDWASVVSPTWVVGGQASGGWSEESVTTTRSAKRWASRCPRFRRS